MLLNYSKCKNCANDNFDCERCSLMKEKENKFETKRHVPNPDYSNIELKLQFLTRYCRWPFSDADKLQTNIKNVISKVIDNVDDAVLKPVMKSYIRHRWGAFRTGVLFLGYKQGLDKELSYTKHSCFKFRNKMYPDNTLLKLILYEFMVFITTDYSDYIEMEEIQQYLDDVFDDEED